MKQEKQGIACPVEVMFDIVSGKWKPMIIWYLLGGDRRFRELQRLIPRVTPQMLTLQLRELEQAGIVSRQVFAEVPPRVEYSLTPLGHTLEPVLYQIARWGSSYCEQNEIEHYTGEGFGTSNEDAERRNLPSGH